MTWYDIRSGAEYLGISQRSLYQLCRDRAIRHSRITAKRVIRFKQVDLDEYVTQSTIEPVKMADTQSPRSAAPLPRGKLIRSLPGLKDYFAKPAGPARRHRGGEIAEN